MNVSTILDQIDLGMMALPEFQRGYVWNREQVRGLMESLYRRYPVGGLLIWSTAVDNVKSRGDAAPPASGWVELLLDGQQRITSLYGVIRGCPPKFFDGNAASFTNLYFNIEDESFEFCAPIKMQDNPRWISVTKVMQGDLSEILEAIATGLDEAGIKLTTALSRLGKLQGIRDINLHEEKITGEDKNIDVVVEIFNRVNSGGTTLSKGDLALAKLCAAWPEARDVMKKSLGKWKKAGYSFKLDWFLRCITAVTTGEAFFSSLSKIDTPSFQLGVQRTERYIDQLLNLIAGRLGLDHADVLGSPGAFPLMCRYLELRDGSFASYAERDRLLYWYVHAFLWGRYAGSTESALSQDLRLIAEKDGALDRLIGQLRQNRGDLRIQPGDFRTWSRGSRFYPLLYMLSRVYGAKDLGSGLELHKQLLGAGMRLELHHIFPKSRLYKHEYSRSDVNAVGNFMFLTQTTNLEVTNRHPHEYMDHYETRNPGVLASQWIPADPKFREYNNYLEFLEQRRILLAEAANAFLDSLDSGTAPQPVIVTVPAFDEVISVVVSPEEEQSALIELNLWVTEQGLPEGDFNVEVLDDAEAGVLALIDLGWPTGLQAGLSQPVAVLLNEEPETEEIVNNAGYRFFTKIDEFKRYVESDILALHLAAD